MYNMFLQGLPESIFRDTLKPPIPLNYNEAKERVKLLAQGQVVIEGILKKTSQEEPVELEHGSEHQSAGTDWACEACIDCST